MLLADSSGDPGLPTWAQYGVLGLLVIAFFTDQIVTGRKYNAAIKERDEERARTEKAEAKLEEKFLPALQQTQQALTLVNEQILPILIELRKVLMHMHDDDRSRQEGRDAVSEIKGRNH